MTPAGWAQIVAFAAVLTALTPLMGAYLVRVFGREPILLDRPLGRLERSLYRALRVDPSQEQAWPAYARSMLVFSAVCLAALYATLRTQSLHPLNPAEFGSGTWDVSFNTAASFVSNTSWQYYAGETTLSTFSQMAGIGVHSFLSAAVGLAVGMAVIRGFAGRAGGTLGSFWVDLVRSLLYVLVPIALVAAVVLVAGGVIQSVGGPVALRTLTGGEQELLLGPVASQAVIKTMGSVGGGFFNVNSAMPFENAMQLSNFVQMLLIVLLPAGLTSAFGRMVGSRRQGWALYAAMLAMFLVSTAVLYAAETRPSPAMQAAGLTGPNLEGKEQRFGAPGTALYAAVTTSGASGAVNGAMESLTGVGSLVPLANMTTGEVVFGGAGSGLASMLMLAVLAVFLAGLMVGRTPQYLGKTVDGREVKLVVVGTVAVPMLVLVATAVAIATSYGRTSLFSDGPQGFAETLYAYVSQGFNNGSAMAGYTGYVQPNAPGNEGAFGISFADLLGGIMMIAGRYLPLLVALAVAGSLAAKTRRPPGAGTMRTDTPTFVVLLVAVVLFVALLVFVPALLLGPAAHGLTPRLF